MRLRKRIGIALAAASMTFASLAHAAALRVGEPVPAMVLADQHGKAVAVPGSARWLLFAPDKAAADLAQAWLKSRGSGALEALQAVYVADISGMPALVTRMFALPRLRELPFLVALASEAPLTADWPRRPGQLTLLAVDRGLLLGIEHAASGQELAQRLQLRPAP